MFPPKASLAQPGKDFIYERGGKISIFPVKWEYNGKTTFIYTVP